LAKYSTRFSSVVADNYRAFSRSNRAAVIYLSDFNGGQDSLRSSPEESWFLCDTTTLRQSSHTITCDYDWS